MLHRKARINLRAGETLAALGLTDPAASRYYYAMYQAAVYALTRRGWTPGRLESGAIEWRHATVLNNISLVRGMRSDRMLYDAMRWIREQADYKDTPVDPALLAAHVDAAREFVEEACR
jgi:hypothetical protein